MWFFWPRARQETMAIEVQQPASIPPALRHLAGSAAKRAVKRNPDLAPEDGTATAYVAWMQDLGLTGEWLQCELYADYEAICGIAGYECLPLKRFKRALRKAGCKCWQADKERDGKRWRPEMVLVPMVDDECRSSDEVLPQDAAEKLDNVHPLPVRKQGSRVTINRSRTARIGSVAQAA